MSLMNSNNGFTPTQLKMLSILSDGMPHTRQELHSCLPDELGPLSNIRIHIHNIRKSLRSKGEDIVCETTGRALFYRHVRLLASANDGKR